MTLGYLEFRDIANTKIVMPMAIVRFQTSDSEESHLFYLELCHVVTPHVIDKIFIVYNNKEARDKDLGEVLHYSGLENKFSPNVVL